jgi:hypothetical protein
LSKKKEKQAKEVRLTAVNGEEKRESFHWKNLEELNIKCGMGILPVRFRGRQGDYLNPS